MIRVGVIGLGFMGATHIAAYQAAQRDAYPCMLAAVCDRNASRRQGELWDVGGNAISDVSARTPAFDPSSARGYERAEDLINDPQIDLVSICTRTDTHVELAARALRAGKHVLVEKTGVARRERDSRARRDRKTIRKALHARDVHALLAGMELAEGAHR